MELLTAASYLENQWTFKVSDHEITANSAKIECSCKIANCSHITFVINKIARQYDITWGESAFNACSKSWASRLAHALGNTPNTGENVDCVVCFDEIGTAAISKCATCRNSFHLSCIERWRSFGNTTCPLCRSAKIPESTPASLTVTGNIKPTATITDIAISFDTTGSMYPCLAKVKTGISALADKLFKEIPGLRLSIIAHGDYCDGDDVIKILDFTNDVAIITDFINSAPSTGGGDYPECYELVLQRVKSLSWRSDAIMKSLVLIGDAPPHEKHENPTKIDWRLEAEALANRNIQVFSVQCLNRGNRESYAFYSEVSRTTNGYHIFLDQFSYVADMIQAVCYKQYNDEYLSKFEAELQTGSGALNHSMRLMFDTILGRKTRDEIENEMNPDAFRLRYSSASSASAPAASSAPSRARTATAATSATTASTADLRPCPPARFQVFEVEADTPIKQFCINMGITFATGRGFYEFTKAETIQASKEIILMDRETGQLYEGEAARIISGIGEGEARLKPGSSPKYRIFIQSTSANRKLISGSGFLYQAPM